MPWRQPRSLPTAHSRTSISIPSIEHLPESEQLPIFQRAAELLETGYFGNFDPDLLRERLEAITPPPLEGEEADEEIRRFEAQARIDLESDGCPPCYPPYLDIPTRNPPEEFREIIEYWASTMAGNEVLCCQRDDWKQFRDYQERKRRRFWGENLAIHVNRVRDRRLVHGLDGHVHLRSDWRQQSQQENWIEFQHFHLIRHDNLVTERLKEERQLDEILNEPVVGMDAKALERWESGKNALRGRVRYTERRIRLANIMLGWIEAQRLAMNQRPPTPAEDDTNIEGPVAGVTHKTTPRQRRSKRTGTSMVLGEAKVAKPLRKSRYVWDAALKALESKHIAPEPHPPTSGSIHPTPTHRETRSRRTRGASPGQLGAQPKPKTAPKTAPRTKPETKSKIGRPGPVITKPQPKPRRRGNPLQILGPSIPPHRLSRLVPEGVKTRSGRISKPPARWPY